MSAELFDYLSIFSIYLATIIFILVSFELGYQIGKYTRSHYEKNVDTAPGPMVAGVLTMLAFVLAFMFSMTASRYDSRKQYVIDEVNAINTAYLRADFLAQPHRTELKRLLREYVDTRLRAIEEKNIEMGITRSIELQKRLWTNAVMVVEQNPTTLNTLLIQSINQIMDIHEKRLTSAIRDRIPSSIWLTLIVIIAFTMVTLGSQTGLVKTRRLIQVIPTVLAFSALITVVVDLDRPSELGLIKVSQEAMIDLQKNMDNLN